MSDQLSNQLFQSFSEQSSELLLSACILWRQSSAKQPQFRNRFRFVSMRCKFSFRALVVQIRVRAFVREATLNVGGSSCTKYESFVSLHSFCHTSVLPHQTAFAVRVLTVFLWEGAMNLHTVGRRCRRAFFHGLSDHAQGVLFSPHVKVHVAGDCCFCLHAFHYVRTFHPSQSQENKIAGINDHWIGNNQLIHW